MAQGLPVSPLAPKDGFPDLPVIKGVRFAAVEAGADNCESDSEYHTITCSTEDFATVRDALEAKYGEPERQGLIWSPNVKTEVDEDTAGQILKLIDALEDSDDVQVVTANFEVSDEIMEKLMAAG